MLLHAKKDTKDGQLSSSSQEDTKDTKGWGRLGRASASTFQSQFLPSKLRADPSLWCCAVTHSTPLGYSKPVNLLQVPTAGPMLGALASRQASMGSYHTQCLLWVF